MFHNIFEKLKLRKKKSKKQKPKIIIDIHEKNSLILSELKSSNEAELQITSLKIADYIIGKIAIERKTISDFISSMINKRLIGQLNHMQRYKQRILIIEGKIENFYKEDIKINSNAIRGFILSIITNYNTPIIFTKDEKETANYLILLAKQQLKPKSEISLHSRIPKTIEEQKQYILEAFPNIGPAKAKLLLEKFKTLEKTFNASEEDLKDVLKKNTKDFINLIKN